MYLKHPVRTHEDAYCANCGGDWRGCAYPHRKGERLYSQFCEKCYTETVYILEQVEQEK
jgi:hypothetical protein